MNIIDFILSLHLSHDHVRFHDRLQQSKVHTFEHAHFISCMLKDHIPPRVFILFSVLRPKRPAMRRLLRSSIHLNFPKRLTSSPINVPSSLPSTKGRCWEPLTKKNTIINRGLHPENGQAAVSRSLEELFLRGARMTHVAHCVWKEILRPGDIVVDATCGNGHDTVILAQLIGKTGQIYGFDIQEEAIHSTEYQLCKDLGYTFNDDHVGVSDIGPEVVLMQKCHSQIPDTVEQGQIRLVCFNLGYLPGGDKDIISSVDTTLLAIQGALDVVMEGGLVSIMSYVGHEGGEEEYATLSKCIQDLPPSRWITLEVRLTNRPKAPILINAWKRLVE